MHEIEIKEAILSRPFLGVTLVVGESPPRIEFKNGPTNPYFRQKYKQVATDAGIVLGHLPVGIKPLEFWIDRLVRYCVAEQPAYISMSVTSGDDLIYSHSLNAICEASATFCAWLDVNSIDEAVLGSDGELHRIVAGVVAKHFEEAVVVSEPEVPPPSRGALRALLLELDGHDAILREALASNNGYIVPVAQYSPIKRTVEEIRTMLGIEEKLVYNGQVSVLRTQILRFRSKLEAATKTLSTVGDIPGTQHPAESNTQNNAENRFPARATWLADRLKEREWDWNHPGRFGGPDRKTVQKILAGKYVQIGALAKLVVALNRNKKGKTITILDVPSN